MIDVLVKAGPDFGPILETRGEYYNADDAAVQECLKRLGCRSRVDASLENVFRKLAARSHFGELQYGRLTKSGVFTLEGRRYELHAFARTPKTTIASGERSLVPDIELRVILLHPDGRFDCTNSFRVRAYNCAKADLSWN